MAHSTGALQQVFSELVVDEVNHMTKFWGFGLWAFPEPLITRIRLTITRLINRTPCPRFDNSDNQKTQASHLRSVVELFQTFGRVMGLVAWNSWPLNTKLELIFTFVQVMHRVRRWQSSLTQSYLQQLLGVSPEPMIIKPIQENLVG
jgi:hypothetical protein